MELPSARRLTLASPPHVSIPWSRRELAALGALAGMVASGITLVIGSATTRPSFTVPSDTGGVPRWIAGALPAYGGTMTAARFILLLTAMWLFYLVALAFADAIHVRWAVVAIVTLTVVFTLAPPLLSRDVFNYIDYGRMGALHHLNPYRHGPVAAHGDPAFPYARWRDTPSVYGPLFTLGTYPLAHLGLAGALWSLKGLTGLAGLGCVGLVSRSARAVGRSPVFAAVLLGLNPIFLVYAVGGAHNDVLALFVVMTAIALALAGRSALGGAALVAAVAVKATAGLALPFMALGSRRRWPVIAGILAATAVIGCAGFAAFGTGVLEPFNLATRHQRLYFVQSVPQHFAVLVGIDPRSHALRTVFRIFVAIAIAVLLVRAAARREWVSGAGWAAVAVLAGTTYLLAWYTIWALPFAALARDRRLTLAALALGTFVIAAHLYYLTL